MANVYKGNLDALNDSDMATDLTGILAQLDIKLSELRDALKGASDKDFSTLESDVESIDGKVPTKTAAGNQPVDIKVDSTIPTDFDGGPVTVGTTAVELTFTGTTRVVVIQADHDNSGTIYVGKSNVASDGSNAVARLEPGEVIDLPYNDGSNPIYAVGSASGQKVYKLALL